MKFLAKLLTDSFLVVLLVALLALPIPLQGLVKSNSASELVLGASSQPRAVPILAEILSSRQEESYQLKLSNYSYEDSYYYGYLEFTNTNDQSRDLTASVDTVEALGSAVFESTKSSSKILPPWEKDKIIIKSRSSQVTLTIISR
ncbi:hypothetical protein COT52_01655 [candidate division WWE3 bacterium CG08_land_8_20_14_0_20_43_13]|uniref:Uncharacterized protein n=1 Tax=candidate division WWE3 bacterium CG08_land_8_20_14_0_20_43_13 TaxID=1975087 RepID=A0A2H0X7N0_UNCKA|nr:MAG: hypothetical protein COT52_01655 [candidate division WWE3 bacterium CG08_land_8_20_14_0_20_43_13]